ncbi:phosphotransferase [Candidatus Poriferisodalis sp.]|uniref:phosphotransferase n=1 Tax=Candidatus Poriferisodalis sp. TaxID=3101277 RepID=UPI003B0170F8
MIPEHTSDITVDWLNERLADVPGIGTVVGLEREPLGVGVGILGELSRLKLSYAAGHDGPSTLIAKCQSAFEENIAFAQAMGFYVREINFYNQIAPDIALRVPHCYAADMAPGGIPFVLLLEEIVGARMIDQLAGASRADCTSVVACVSSLHSRFWESEELYALDWLPPMNNDLYKGAAAIQTALWDGFTARWGSRLPRTALDSIERVTGCYGELLDWWADQGNATFTHTDCRADNYLFGGSAGTDVTTVLDFQLSTRHVGVWDIANFMAASVTTANRRAWEHDVVHEYHAALLAKGVSDEYTFERCWREYRYCLLQQAWAITVAADLEPANERGRALLDAMTIRPFQAVEDLRAWENLDELA